MKVVEVTTKDQRTRYYLADDAGVPIAPVLAYLKFKDDAGYARNTLRMHCIHLKHYFTFLQETCRDYETAGVDTLARFIGWLKNPDIGKRVIPLRLEPAHKAQTINIMPEEIPELLSYMEDVMPGREEECGMKPDVLDTVIDVGLYLPPKDSERD